MADSKQKKPYQDILDQILADFAKLGAFGGKPDTSAPNVNQEVDFTNSSESSNQEAWQNTLNSILQSGNYDVSGIVAMLEGYLNHSRPQSTERNDMFYQYLLQLLTTSEQRGYDWKMLQESRLYNNPTNELARLMGAGISRDAALQMLSGSGSGSGSGNSSPLIGSGLGATAPSPSGTSGDQNVAIANTVLNGMQAVSSLVQSGMSIAEAVPQVQMLNAQSYMTKKNVQAFDDVNEVTQLLQRLQYDGAIERSDIDSWHNANDVYDWLLNNSDYARPIMQSGAMQRTFGTTIGRSMFNAHWKEQNKSRTDGEILDSYIQGMHLDNSLKSVNIDKVGAEMTLIGTQSDLNVQEMIESCHRVASIDADVRVKDAEGRWIQVQTDYYPEYIESVIGLNDANAYEATQQGNLLHQSFDLNSAGFPMLKEARVLEIQDELERWQIIRSDKTYTPAERDKMLTERQRYWLMQKDNAFVGAYLTKIYQGAVSGFADQNPNLWKLACGFQYSGAQNLVNSGSGAAGAGAAGVNAVGGLIKAAKYIPK